MESKWKFGHKQFYSSISVKSKPNKSELRLTKAIKKAERCWVHRLKMTLFIDKPLRLYRRGKNRCKDCGASIQPPHTQERKR